MQFQKMWSVIVDQHNLHAASPPQLAELLGNIDFMERLHDGTIIAQLIPEIYPDVPSQWPSYIPIDVQFTFLHRALNLLRRMRKYDLRGYRLLAQEREASPPSVVRHFVNSAESSSTASIR